MDGKERKLSLGRYPDVSLSEARKRRDASRAQIAPGADPAREKQRENTRAKLSVDNTFEAIAAEYCAKRQRDDENGWAQSTVVRTESLLTRLNASIGRLPIGEIEPVDVLAAVRKIEARGKLESARRTLQLASLVFRYAIATARLTSDPTRDLRGALTSPTVTHYGAGPAQAHLRESGRAFASRPHCDIIRRPPHQRRDPATLIQPGRERFTAVIRQPSSGKKIAAHVLDRDYSLAASCGGLLAGCRA
ncbi:tyrosine-type recombinase/integrase [Sphingopyxis terrae]|uniref:tyrosine-type recombinase/integrase n=1 Tax=Sphingopyxis terrae TaxID=33052 RepID=UPI000A362559|nr:DUF4102 domain-containing protein [Sphingopyxis terrae subsp. ummariensis]